MTPTPRPKPTAFEISSLDLARGAGVSSLQSRERGLPITERAVECANAQRRYRGQNQAPGARASSVRHWGLVALISGWYSFELLAIWQQTTRHKPHAAKRSARVLRQERCVGGAPVSLRWASSASPNPPCAQLSRGGGLNRCVLSSLLPPSRNMDHPHSPSSLLSLSLVLIPLPLPEALPDGLW